MARELVGEILGEQLGEAPDCACGKPAHFIARGEGGEEIKVCGECLHAVQQQHEYARLRRQQDDVAEASAEEVAGHEED